MAWIRVDCDRHSNPKIRAIGPWGNVALQAAWEVAKCSSAGDGTISELEWTADHLAWWTMFDREPGASEQFADGMRRAESCGLVRVRDDGRVELHDWSEYQQIGRDAERQQRRRAKLASVGHVTSRDVTDGHAASRSTGQDRQDRTDRTEKEPANAPRLRGAAPLPSEHWAWGLVDSYHAERCSEPVNRAAEAATLAALERVDGHPAALVAEVLAWVAADVVDPPRGTWAGWAGVVRSLVSLPARKTKGDASKFEKILAQYRDARKPRAEQRTRFPSAPVNPTRCAACGALLLYPDEGCDHCKAAAAAGGN